LTQSKTEVVSTNLPGAGEQRRVGIRFERFRQIVAAFAGPSTAGRILPADVSDSIPAKAVTFARLRTWGYGERTPHWVTASM